MMRRPASRRLTLKVTDVVALNGDEATLVLELEPEIADQFLLIGDLTFGRFARSAPLDLEAGAE